MAVKFRNKKHNNISSIKKKSNQSRSEGVAEGVKVEQILNLLTTILGFAMVLGDLLQKFILPYLQQ